MRKWRSITLCLADNLAVQHLEDAPGHGSMNRRMGYHHDGGSAGANLFQEIHHRFAIGGVQIASWFIGQD